MLYLWQKNVASNREKLRLSGIGSSENKSQQNYFRNSVPMHNKMTRF